MKYALIALTFALPAAAYAAPTPSITLSAHPTSVTKGNSSVLTLIASGVDTCYLNGKPVKSTSTTKVVPVPTSPAYPAVLYTATCYTLPNKGGTKVSADAPVFVLAPASANAASLSHQAQVAGIIVSIQNLLRQMSQLSQTAN
jgi:hypothetical protein